MRALEIASNGRSYTLRFPADRDRSNSAIKHSLVDAVAKTTTRNKEIQSIAAFFFIGPPDMDPKQLIP